VNVKKYCTEVLSTLKGRYLKFIDVDGKRYFTFDVDLPYQQVQSYKKLPSDATYRLDINYWKCLDDERS